MTRQEEYYRYLLTNQELTDTISRPDIRYPAICAPELTARFDVELVLSFVVYPQGIGVSRAAH